MKDKLKSIINYYGINAQQRQLNEEVFELQEAITNAEYMSFASSKEIYHIAEELADVEIMLRQIQLHYDISSEAIKHVMRNKVERQLKRMEEK